MSRGTPQVAIRIDPELWQQAKQAAAAEGETISDVIRRYLIEYVNQHGS